MIVIDGNEVVKFAKAGKSMSVWLWQGKIVRTILEYPNFCLGTEKRGRRASPAPDMLCPLLRQSSNFWERAVHVSHASEGVGTQAVPILRVVHETHLHTCPV
jgi:hypothetical protein